MSNSQIKLRKAGLRARSSLSYEDRESASTIIAENVTQSAWFQRAEYVACYLSTRSEVDTWAIISRAWTMKKRVFVPIIQKEKQMRFQEITTNTNLLVKKYGIKEPEAGKFINPRMLDVVLTPVVAFDNRNHRIGMGGGYFDRTFSFLKLRENWFHPKLIGLAFSCQKVKKIFPNPWDIPLFSTVTEAK